MIAIRVCAMVVVVMAACSGSAGPKPEPATAVANANADAEAEADAAAAAPAAAAATATATATAAVDERVACQYDNDCVIYASCCAYCFDGTVVSLNKAYAAYGSLLTLTFYCPSCAEGCCNMMPPKRTPICKAGVCARRDTTEDHTGKVTSVVVDNDPAQLEPSEGIEILATMLHHLCTRSVACGDHVGGSCDDLKVPPRHSCDAATKCYAAIDRMPCAGKSDLLSGLDAASKLPACAKIDRLCLP